LSARSYDVAVTALTVDAPLKWIDNLLSHHEVPGCSGSRQGIERRVSDHGVLCIAVIRLLNAELRIPLAHAVQIVAEGYDGRGLGELRTPSGIRIQLPLADIEHTLHARLLDALQSAPPRRRGRPRQLAR